MNSIFREYIFADDLQNAAHALLNPQSLTEFRAESDTRSHGDDKISADRDQDLRLHSPARGTQPEKRLHAKGLLDPLEEEWVMSPVAWYDLPSRLVDLRHDECIDLEVVGNEHESLSRYRNQEADTPKGTGIEPLGFGPVEPNALVRSQARGLFDRPRLLHVEAHVGLGPCGEEGPSQFDGRQSEEVDGSAIQYVEGSSFEDDPIQGVDVVDLPVRDRHEHGDRAAQLDHGMELDRGLALSKAGPRKEVHAQVYGGSVDGVDDIVEIEDVS